MEVGTEVDGGEPDGELVRLIFESSPTDTFIDSDPLSSLMSLDLKTDFALSAFDAGSFAGLSRARLTLDLNDPEPPDGIIPLPATGLLLAGGLGLFGLLRRSRKG